MAKTTVKGKLKKATLMAGIAAATAMPLKSSAQTTTQDAKENKVEISINPDQVRENIRLMQMDSINIANFNNFNREILNQHAKIWMSHARLSRVFDDFVEEQSSDNLDAIRIALSELQHEMEGERSLLAKYLAEGVYLATDVETQEEINGKLLEQRVLLKLAENEK